MIAAVVEATAGRAKVMAGTGSNSTDEALRLTRWAAKRGADAALVVAPYYNKPTQEGFFQHFKALAEAVDIPICVYNIPGRTGKNIEADTIVRMAELPNITMVKEASGSMDAASQILAKTESDSPQRRRQPDAAALVARRARGRFGGGQHRARDVIAMLRAFDCRQFPEARCLHFKLFPLCRDMLGLSTNPIPIKAAMQMLGRDSGRPADAADAAQPGGAGEIAEHARGLRAAISADIAERRVMTGK